MADIFVSYKAEDRARVAPLVNALEADGYSVWWDGQIGGGAPWRQTIEAELEAARCVLVVWSKRATGPEGAFVQDEATRAQRKHIYLPVVIDRARLPLGFGEVQALSLIGWHGDRSDERYQAILSAVRQTLRDGKTAPVLVRGRTMPVDRRSVVAGGVVAAAAIGGAGWMLIRPTGSGQRSDSIAVLPFANLSGDPAQSYFSDGIAEELRSALARLGGLKVVGRTSSEAVRNLDVVTAARKLRVANILTGSVRQSRSTIRISAELVDGRTGLDRWSQDYDRSPGDAIAIQVDIAGHVAGSLSAALGVAARQAITAGRTTNAQAQKLALQADQLASDMSERALRGAINLLDAAINLDPNYAEAYARKALLMATLANSYGRNSDEVNQGRAQALATAHRAIGLAPGLPYGHLALGYIYRTGLRLREGSAEFERAVALAPNDARILRNYGIFLARTGKLNKALRIADKVVALDPLNGVSWDLRVSALYLARRYREAVAAAGDAPPGITVSRTVLGDCQMMLGNIQEARQSYAGANSDDPGRLVGEAVLAARTGDRARAMAGLERMKQRFGDAASYQFAEIYAQMGQPDDALAALDQAWKVKDGGLLRLRVDPWLDPVRNSARFSQLIRRMDFPP